MSQYAFTHESNVFTPDGRIDIRPDQVDAFNRAAEERELAALQEHPDKALLYVKLPKYIGPSMSCGPATATELDRASINTWTGLSVASNVWVGPRRYIGFGHHTYRRAVTCTLFGVAYHGWYMESSGDYCRLTRSKGKKVSK